MCVYAADLDWYLCLGMQAEPCSANSLFGLWGRTRGGGIKLEDRHTFPIESPPVRVSYTVCVSQ